MLCGLVQLYSIITFIAIPSSHFFIKRIERMSIFWPHLAADEVALEALTGWPPLPDHFRLDKSNKI